MTHMKKRLGFLLFAAALFLLGPAGCSCTLQANASVVVKVVDAFGALVTDAIVKYCVDDGIEKPCEFTGSRYRCGVEEDGDFTITARKGMLAKTVEIEVEADVCHVDTQSVTIQLGD